MLIITDSFFTKIPEAVLFYNSRDCLEIITDRKETLEKLNMLVWQILVDVIY